ncbi:hypothetical protein LEA_10506, partial [human gut metagenome]
NIVKNAIEYSPDGSVIEIDSGENPMYSWISVRDSGMGMDKQSMLLFLKGLKTLPMKMDLESECRLHSLF